MPLTSNPLIAPWTGPYGGVPPWNQAKAEYFPGAFEAALAEQRAEIEAIVADDAAPNFDNTIAALQRAGQTLDRVGRLFGVMTRQHEHARVSEAGSRVAAEACGGRG